MVRNFVPTLDERLDARAGPQVGLEALRAGPGDEPLDQILLLAIRQKAGSAGVRHRRQGILPLLANRLPPTIDAAPRHPQSAGDLVGRQSFVQERDGFKPSLLQLLGTSMCSHALS